MSSADASLQAESAVVAALYLKALHAGTSVPQACFAFLRRGQECLDSQSLQEQTIAVVRQTAALFEAVSCGLATFDERGRAIKGDVERQLCDYFARNHPTPPALSADISPSSPSEDALVAPYRGWFVSNFSNPYPSTSDKSSLLLLVPSHDKKQLDTWFTNNRRRSGWQSLKRQHTNGTAEHLEELLFQVDEDDETVSQEVKEKVRSVRRFFEEGARDQISEHVQAIVSRGAPTSATRRKLETRSHRGVGSHSSASNNGVHPRGNIPYRRPHTTPTPSSSNRRPKPSLYDTSNVYTSSPTDLVDYPRYPSTFSSPSSSLRTVSDSSTSSYDSLISYASASSFSAAPELPIPLPPSTPSPTSPPASSSLLSFDGNAHRRPSTSTVSSFSQPSPTTRSFPPPPSRQPGTQPAFFAPPPPPQRPHPYFYTLNELPPSSSLADFGGMGARRDRNGDLLVE